MEAERDHTSIMTDMCLMSDLHRSSGWWTVWRYSHVFNSTCSARYCPLRLDDVVYPQLMMSHLGLYINDVCPFPMLPNSFQPCLYRPLKGISALIQLRPLSPTPSTRRKPVVMLTEKYLFIVAISLIHF